MRAPGFWHEKPGLASRILGPLGAIYAAGTARRLSSGARVKAGVPVICVGNINVGGTGKTPTVTALVQRLKDRGHQPAVLTKGYGGSVTGPHKVDERKDTASDVGDEALLHAAFSITWVAKDRVQGAKAAASAGADVIVMDDGFQSSELAIDFGLVVVDAKRGFGNGRCIPAGPLREPLETGLKRASALISIGDLAAQQQFDNQRELPPALPRLRGRLSPLKTGMDWHGLRVVAFAGIAHPEKFFTTLTGLGAKLIETHALSDHQPLSAALMQRLIRRARELDARLVATEKDAVRLPSAVKAEVLTLPVRLAVEDWTVVDGVLERLGL